MLTNELILNFDNDNLMRQYYLDTIGIQSWLLKTTIDSIEYVDEEYEAIADEKSAEKAEVQLEAKAEKIEKVEQLVEQSIKQSVKPPVKKVIDKPIEPIVELKTQENIEEKTVVVEHSEVSISEQQPKNKPLLMPEITACQQCSSRLSRLNVLLGQGNPQAQVLIIGLPPNAEEDRTGQYLSEQSQTLLDKMMAAVDLQDHYFYTGILKCYSLEQLLISPEDWLHCKKHLWAQIVQIKPRAIFVLGTISAQQILTTEDSFNHLRKENHSIQVEGDSYPLVVSYHPAYLLRNPSYKRATMDDLLRLKALVNVYNGGTIK